MTSAKLHLAGSLLPWQRAQRAGKRGITSPAQRAQQRAIQLAWLAQVPPAQRAAWDRAGRYAVSVVATWPDAKRRDLDNASKQVLDALTGLAWDDDSQVDALLAVRTTPDRDAPCVYVTIMPAAPVTWQAVAAAWIALKAERFFGWLATWFGWRSA